MEAVIQLRSDVARLLQGNASRRALPEQLQTMKQSLDDALARLGVSLRPIHPGVEDAELARYFALSGTSSLEDEQTLVALRDLDAVTAAYSKPEAELA